MRKICPKSGEKCDCPKGSCNAVAQQAYNEFASMRAYTQHALANDAAQADSLEAHSLKYQACAQIMQLSSGRFALFGAYRAGGGSGIELIAIGEWAELEEHVRAYKQLADDAYARGQERTLPVKTAADYDSLFGPEES